MNFPDRKHWHSVKVFGERNTATRAVMAMLIDLRGVSMVMPRRDCPDLDHMEQQARKHFKNISLELFLDEIEDQRARRLGGMSDWKHAAPRIDNSYAILKASVLFLVRNPYSWIWSLSQHNYHSRSPWQPDLGVFIEQPWLCLKRDNIGPFVNSPMQLWNEKLLKYQHFSQQAPVPSSVLKFEEFVTTPVQSLGACLQRFGIDTSELATIEAPTKSNGTGHAKRRQFYQAEGWRDYFSARTVELVNDLVDWDLAANFGYDRLDPKEFPKVAPLRIKNKLSKERLQF